MPLTKTVESLSPSFSVSRSYISGTTSSPIYGPRSFLHVSDTTVLARARDLDEKLRRNEKVGPLAGVLAAVKDNICTAEMPTAGSRVLEGYTPPNDATAMRKIKELGGIVVGKTNLDEFGMGNTTEGSVKLWMSLDEFGQNHKFSEVVEMKDIWRMIPGAGFTSMEFSTGFE